MAAAVRGRRDLRARAARPAPGPDRRAQPRAQRDRLPRRGAGPRRRAAAADEALASRRRAWARCTGCRSRSRTPTRVAGWRTTYGSPLLRRPRRRPRRPGRRADPRRRARCSIGKTNVPEFAAGLAHLQPGLRHDPQPGRPDAGPPAGRAGERRARWRPGWCRSPTAPTWAARCATRRRSAASSGMRPSLGRVPEWPLDNQWETHVGRRADGPQRRRPRPAALGARRPRPARPARARRPGLDLRAAADAARCRACGSRCSVDLGGAFEVDHEVAAVVRGRRGRLSDAGARGRRRAPRPRPGRRHLPHAARVALPGQVRRRCSPSTPTRSSRRSPTTSGPGRVADRRRRRPRLRAAHRARRDDARSSSATYDVLVLPVSQVPPFPADQEFPADDQRPADGDLPRLDALGVLHHRHRLPGHLGAGRHTADGLPGRRSRSSRRTAPTAGCSRSRRPSRPCSRADPTGPARLDGRPAPARGAAGGRGPRGGRRPGAGVRRSGRAPRWRRRCRGRRSPPAT